MFHLQGSKVAGNFAFSPYETARGYATIRASDTTDETQGEHDMIQGVIFDMDGLMFDTENIWTAMWRPALAELGMSYKEGLAEAVRGTNGEASRAIVRQFYGPDCDAKAVMDTLLRLGTEAFRAAPVPKKPGLDELLAWLREHHIPTAVASSSREEDIRYNLESWGLTPFFQVIVAGPQIAHSKPDPEIFLTAAARLGVEPARCLVLEDSYNGVRAGAAGGFVTVMVPDLMPPNDEMHRLCTMECGSLLEVLERLRAGEL